MKQVNLLYHYFLKYLFLLTTAVQPECPHFTDKVSVHYNVGVYIGFLGLLLHPIRVASYP